MLDFVLPLALLHWLLLLTPGPNVLLVSQLAASSTRSAGLAAALGISLVAALWAGLAVLGLQAVFVAYPRLRLGFQLIGSAYLLYLAWRLWRYGSPLGAVTGEKVSVWQAFRLGLLTNLTNPKSVLFFGSVFAAALPEQRGAALSLIVVLVIFGNALVWHIALALAFGQGRLQKLYQQHARSISRIAGLLLGAFGARLMLSSAREI